jgi:hypothetical protein
MGKFISSQLLFFQQNLFNLNLLIKLLNFIKLKIMSLKLFKISIFFNLTIYFLLP